MAEYEMRLYTDGELAGRRKILTNKKEITADNVVEVLTKALATHFKNCREIRYLERVYRGVQDIRCRCKKVRPEINNKITVNIANEIVTFKTAFFLSTPIQYVSTGGEDEVSKQVQMLNTLMRAEDKDSKDKEICDWFHIAGVAERLVLPDRENPFAVYTISPCDAFVIYSSGIGQAPMAGVIIQRDEEDKPLYSIYTEDRVFEVSNGKVTIDEPHYIGTVPLVEYLNNEARIGAFEVVLSILNAINNLESNRLDDIEQFVQSILVLKNCELDEDKMKSLKEQLGIMIKDNGQVQSDVFRVDGELSQDGAQTVKNDLYDSVLTICGMPNRNGGSSTSDTGSAVMYRDGFVEAESRAKDTEKMYDRADKQFLKAVFNICRDKGVLDLNLEDVKTEHARNNLSNMQSRMQVLCEGLNNDMIHPQFPWVMSGVPNAEEWYRKSMEWREEQEEKLNRTLQEEMNNGMVSDSGQGDQDAESQGGTAVRENQADSR